jgi:hypothetical protein
MQTAATHKAADLPPDVRSAVEQILGRPVGADEEVSVVAVPPGRMAASESRASVAQQLENLLNRRAAKVEDASDEEIDAAVDEAVDHVRHSRK